MATYCNTTIVVHGCGHQRVESEIASFRCATGLRSDPDPCPTCQRAHAAGLIEQLRRELAAPSAVVAEEVA